ncbi:MAG: phospholipase D family protein [Candidatus Dormibacteraeota bacterium]|nr:phospholipase D family protein [Candidatus Dormibacteraeota bacterium]
MTGPRDQVDDALGQALEHLTIAHHRRRLRRVGWEAAMEPRPGPWADGDPPARQGNMLEVLIDGAEAFARLAEDIRQARSYVHLTGWHIMPDFALTRDDTPVILRDLLAERAHQIPVRVLIWAGAPVPLLRPWRGDVRKVKARLETTNRIQVALDQRERPMHCHHEKTIVIDDRVAYVGGIDLTSFNGDRWDTTRHQARSSVGWHDVATRIAGPAVADVAANFALRWQAVTAQEVIAGPPSEPVGNVELQVVRTMPDGMYPRHPQGDFRILQSYLRGLSSAKHLIYIENQFLWSPEILGVLREKLRNPPSPDFRLLVVLPAKPNSGGDDTRGQLGTLLQADGENNRVLACTLVSTGGSVQDLPIYVHAKVAIVDDQWMTIGSANLNEHSLFNDTEMNVVTHDAPLITKTRHRLWAEHLERPIAEMTGNPTELIDKSWRPIAQEQAERVARQERQTHRLTLLPGVSRRSGLLRGPLQGLVVDA